MYNFYHREWGPRMSLSMSFRLDIHGPKRSPRGQAFARIWAALVEWVRLLSKVLEVATGGAEM